MSDNETYHLSTDEPFVALCGQRTVVERNGHALTSMTHLVTCPECKRRKIAEVIQRLGGKDVEAK